MKASFSGWRDTRIAVLTKEDRELWAANPFPVIAGLQIFACGIFTAATDHLCRRQAGRFREGVVIYCTAGRGFYEQDGRRWEIVPGDLLYCPPESAHCYGADDREPWTINWLHLSGRNRPQYERMAGFDTGGPVWRIGIQPRLVERFQRLVNRCHPAYCDARIMAIQAEATGILAAIGLTPENMKRSPDQTLTIQRIQELMEERLDQPFDLAAYAGEAGYNPAYFLRLFKKVTGTTPGTYCARMRVTRARAMLQGSTLSVKEIAARLGFATPNYFSSVFRKSTGQSPNAFRNAQGAQLHI